MTPGGSTAPCAGLRPRILFAGVWVLTLWGLLVTGVSASDVVLPAHFIRELRAGLAAHDVGGLWSGASKEAGLDVGVAVIFNRVLFQLPGAAACPEVGVHINTANDTSMLYGGFLLQWETASAFLFATGLGLAVHNGCLNTDATDRKSLGSRVLFRIPVEVGYALNQQHRIVIAFDHVSNAYLAQPNEGMDTLALVYAYRFE